MEQTFKKQASHNRFIDYFNPTPSPTRHPYSLKHCPPSNPTHPSSQQSGQKAIKFNTQVASSRTAKKIAPSTHMSPKHNSKNSMLSYLHKCRSDWEESTSTVMTQSKQTVKAHHPQAKSTLLSQNSTKTVNNDRRRSSSRSRNKQLVQRTESVLSIYRSRCSKL